MINVNVKNSKQLPEECVYASKTSSQSICIVVIRLFKLQGNNLRELL